MAQVHMPDQLMAELKELSVQQDISVEQFLASLTREGISNYKSFLAMKARAKKVSPGLARSLLDRIVPDVPPDPGMNCLVGLSVVLPRPKFLFLKGPVHD